MDLVVRECKDIISMKITVDDLPKLFHEEEKEILEDPCLLFNCIECHKDYEMTEDHFNWYIIRNMHLPKRCPHCLKKKKEE